jgi:hypothetical protein
VWCAAEPYDVLDAQLDLGVGLLLDHGDPAGDVAAAQFGEGAAVEGDDTRGRGEDAGEQAQEGGLAGAVRAEQSDGGAGGRGDADAVEDDPAVGGARDTVGAETLSGCRLRVPGSRCRLCASALVPPAGARCS